MNTPISIFCAAFLCCSIARAESVFNWLEPLDQNVGDVNTLGTSLRVVEQGLTVPSGFQGLYRVRNQDNVLIRANGAVYAAFPQSVYRMYRDGLRPDIPPDTVFYIGAPPEWLTETPAVLGPRADGQVDQRIDLRVQPTLAESSLVAPSVVGDLRVPPYEPVPIPPTPTSIESDGTPPLPAIVGDGAYRLIRWAELLGAAAKQK